MNWDRVPDWRFGDILRCTHPNWMDGLGLFLYWDYVVDFNPTESIAIILNLSSGRLMSHYCGWWEPVA